MKVALVIPTYFDDSSVIAGAERYAYELAKAMAKKTETVLITFASRDVTHRSDGLTVRYCKRLFYLGSVVNPIAVSFLKELADVEVIHCLQFRTFVTELAILYGRVRGKRVYVTDLAGGVRYNLSTLLPIWKGIRAFLPISEYNRHAQAEFPVERLIIYGGVDTGRFTPGHGSKRSMVLFVGRLMPHKGIDILIDALSGEAELEIVGQADDQRYLEQLKTLARGKRVTFNPPISDTELIAKYRQARLTAIPSTADGGYTTALESMACGTPVVASNVGSLPELVADGQTGLIVPPHDPVALRAKISLLVGDTRLADEMGKAGRQRVLERFTWDAVADRCLDAYRLPRSA